MKLLKPDMTAQGKASVFSAASWRMWFAQGTTTIRTKKQLLLYPLLTLVVVGALSVFTVVYMAHLQADRARDRAQTRVAEMANAIESDLEKAMAPVANLAGIWINNQDMLGWNPRLFPAPSGAPVSSDRPATHRDLTVGYPQSLKDTVHRAQADVLDLSIIPGSAVNIQWQPCGVVSYVYPPEGNEPAIGHDLMMDPARIQSIRATISKEDNSGIVMSGPIYIPRMPTGVVFGRYAVWGPSATAQCAGSPNLEGLTIEKGGKHWQGLVVIMFDMRKLVNETWLSGFVNQEGLHYNVQSKKGDVISTSHKDVVYFEIEGATGTGTTRGGEAHRLPHNGTDPSTFYRVNIDFGGLGWFVEVHPIRNTYIPEWRDPMLVVVVFVTLLAAFVVLLLAVSQRQKEVLLLKMMPRHAASRIQNGQEVIEAYPKVTIFFSDIVGYTSIAGTMTPIEVMVLLNELYTQFDKLCEYWDLYKVETIGDAYMVVGGAPEKEPAEDPSESARRVARFGLDCLELVKKFESTTAGQIKIRCGLNSGPVVAGVVGKAMPRYCLFGDTVNTASRMESTSIAGEMHISQTTKDLLDQCKDEFVITQRTDGETGAHGINIKGKGVMSTYWITDVKHRISPSWDAGLSLKAGRLIGNASFEMPNRNHRKSSACSKKEVHSNGNDSKKDLQSNANDESV